MIGLLPCGFRGTPIVHIGPEPLVVACMNTVLLLPTHPTPAGTPALAVVQRDADTTYVYLHPDAPKRVRDAVLRYELTTDERRQLRRDRIGHHADK